jgi:endonuclease YncB( thermonuclease family)
VTDFGPMPPGPNHVHRARALYPHDGDSVIALVELDFGTRFETSLRLLGLDAPELGTRANPNPAGVAALEYVVRWLAEADPEPSATGWPLVVFSKSWDKYGGRADAILWRRLDGRALNADLLASGHAVPMP